MRRISWIAIFFLPCIGYAQGVPYAVNPPAPNAQIYVCSAPAAGGNPCTNTVAIYNDTALSSQITQPAQVGPTGAYTFYYSPQNIIVQITGRADQFIGGGGGGLPTGCSSPGAGQITCTGAVTATPLVSTTNVQTGVSPPLAVLAGVTGGIGFAEASTTCTPTAGQDCIRADTSHALLASVNGGTEAPIAQFNGAITGTKCVQSSGTLGLITETGSACSAGGVAFGNGAGAVNVMTVTTSPAVATNAAGTIVAVLPNLANTTSNPTLAVGGQTALTITKYGTQVLVGSDYTTTQIAYFVSDGTHWQLINPATAVNFTGAALTNNGPIYGGGTNQAHTQAKCAAVGTAANPSVAACAGAYSGVFSCATASSGNCQVTLTTAAAGSAIFIVQDMSTSVGTTLGVTCNVTPSTVIPWVTARVNGTSFSFSITTPVTNPDCFSFTVIN